MRAFRPSFRKLLGVYCNDAVCTAHRAPSSTVTKASRPSVPAASCPREGCLCEGPGEATLVGTKVKDHVQMITKEIPKYHLQGEETIAEVRQVRASEVRNRSP